MSRPNHLAVLTGLCSALALAVLAVTWFLNPDGCMGSQSDPVDLSQRAGGESERAALHVTNPVQEFGGDRGGAKAGDGSMRRAATGVPPTAPAHLATLGALRMEGIDVPPDPRMTAENDWADLCELWRQMTADVDRSRADWHACGKRLAKQKLVSGQFIAYESEKYPLLPNGDRDGPWRTRGHPDEWVTLRTRGGVIEDVRIAPAESPELDRSLRVHRDLASFRKSQTEAFLKRRLVADLSTKAR